MTEPTAPELDPREELASLIGSTRALLEQYEASGADALAAGEPAAVAAFLAGSALPAPRGGAAAPAFRPATGAAFSPERTPPPRPPAGDMAGQRFTAPSSSPAAKSFGSQSLGSPPSATRPAAPGSPQPPDDSHRAPPAREAGAPHREAPRAPAANHEAAPARDAGQLGIAAAAGPVVPSSPDADDRRMRLALVAEEVRACTRCGLCEQRRQTVFARGNPYGELCFVGEGPGADEDAQGEPFVGKAGQLLDRMIAAMGYRRDEVYICNIVKCRPPENRKPEASEIEACSSYLREQLALVKPKVIVALGGTAVTGLIGTTEGITRMRGKWKLYKGATPIMPTFHPSYLLREPSKKREVWADLQEVMNHLGRAPGKSGAESGGRGPE